MSKILIVEDDATISMGVSYYLKQETFEVEVAEDIAHAKEILNNKKDIDLVLLDLTLPDGSGYDFFQEIDKKIPVIFLTARDDELNVVMALDMGAYDYITKPFKARELLARIKSALRKSNTNEDSIITLDHLEIDVKQAKVLKNGKEVMLTALEYRILLILITNLNQVFTREKILADIWDVKEEYVNDNTLTVYVKRLREKIEEDPSNPKIIETVRGIGYRVVSR